MRLSSEPAPRSEREPTTQPRLGLWGPLYFFLWLNSAMLALVVLYARNPAGFYYHLGGWSAGLAVVAFLTCTSRVSLHDLVVGLGERDRFLLGLFVGIPALLPAFVRGPRVIPDGFLWAVPGMLLITVTPALTRRFLALTLAGAWLASMHITDANGLAMLLGFAFSWLLALGATHIAHTGDPYGLGGFWPVRKVIFNSVAAAIPATVAALMVWQAWPEPAPQPRLANQPPPPRPRLRMIDRLDTLDKQKLVWDLAVVVVTVALTLVILHYLRKLFLRHRRVAALSLIPGQVAQLETAAEPPPARKLKLGGRRGKIVQLWGRWAAAVGKAGTERQPGETAAAYARRLEEVATKLNPPPEMTQLLERVHYGKDNPREADLEAMQRYVKEQTGKLKK